MDTIIGLNRNGAAIIATGVLFSILTTVAVVLRFLSKRVTNAPYGVDDWLLLIALLMFILAEALVIRSDVVGRAASSEDDPRYQTYLAYLYVYSVFYWPVIALAQASLLFLYRRIFVTKFFRYTSNTLIVLCLIWAIPASVIEIGYPSNPINYYFPGGPTTSFNVDYLTFWFVSSVMEVVVDTIILVLPIREINKLQLSLRKKILLSLIFLLGGFVIITGIIRIVTLYAPAEVIFDLTQGDIWFNVHLGTAITCACLPTLRPIVTASSKKLLSWSRSPTPTNKISLSSFDKTHNRKARQSQLTHETSIEKMLAGQQQEVGNSAEAKRSSSSSYVAGGFEGVVEDGQRPHIEVTRTVEVI